MGNNKEFEDRRKSHGRRESDMLEPPEDISDFRLSLKEVGFLLAVLISVATTLFNFNSQIEKTNSAQAVVNERNSSSLIHLRNQQDKQEGEISSLKEQVTNIDSLTTLMYQQKSGSKK